MCVYIYIYIYASTTIATTIITITFTTIIGTTRAAPDHASSPTLCACDFVVASQYISMRHNKVCVIGGLCLLLGLTLFPHAITLLHVIN